MAQRWAKSRSRQYRHEELPEIARSDGEGLRRGGRFWTGDLAMMHPDGYIEIRDRSKEIVISGGESISSIEIEKVQYEHPAVSVAAAVAAPDEK